MNEFDLLHRLAQTKMPTSLVLSHEIDLARNLKVLGCIRVAIPAPKKGRDNYGEQDPAVVLEVTRRGKQAVETKSADSAAI